MSLVTPGIGLMVWMTIAFLVVLFLLTKMGWKPILSSLKEREETIDNALKAAEKAREEMKQLTADNERILQEAKDEKGKIIREAKEVRDKMIAEAKDKASAEATKIVEDAKNEIENQKMAAITEVKNSAGNMAIELAENLLRKQLDNKEEHKQYIKEMVDKFDLN